MKDLNIKRKQDCFDLEDVFQLFVNMLMRQGKKSLALKISNHCLLFLKEFIRIEELGYEKKSERNSNLFFSDYDSKKLLKNAIDIVRPTLEVRKVRVSGRTLQVPAIVTKKRSYHLAIRWILQSAQKRQKVSGFRTEKSNFSLEKSFLFSRSLAIELKEILKKSSHNITVANSAVQIKEDLHRLALNNRPFYHYRWWKR